MIDSHIATFNPAELLEFVSKGGKPGVCFRVALGKGPKHADPPHPVTLLRPCPHRPHGRAAKPRKELPPFHSITLSAMVRSVGGTSMPRALAVPVLMTNSNRVDCTTGRSAGLAPLRILPVYTP